MICTLGIWPNIGHYLNDKLKYHTEFFFILYIFQDEPSVLYRWSLILRNRQEVDGTAFEPKVSIWFLL